MRFLLRAAWLLLLPLCLAAQVGFSGRVSNTISITNDVPVITGIVGDSLAALRLGPFLLQNSNLDAADTYYHFKSYIKKTTGVTDNLDYFYGIHNNVLLSQSGGTIGGLFGLWNSAEQDYGEVANYFSFYNLADADNDTVTGDLYGFYNVIDQEAGHVVGSEVFGIKCWMDLDGTVGSIAYMLYLDGLSGIDYGVYQNSEQPNYLAGKLGLGTNSPGAPLDVEDATITTSDTYYGIKNYHKKTGGLTDINDSFVGISNNIEYASAVGTLKGMVGFGDTVRVSSGSVPYVYGANHFIDLNAGIVDNGCFGVDINIDQEAANGVTGYLDILKLRCDLDGTVDETTHMIYMDGLGIDYGIYQVRDNPNYLAGCLGIGINSVAGLLSVYDATVSSTDSYYGFKNYHIKTTGDTDPADDFYGIQSTMSLNHADYIGDLKGAYFEVDQTLGNVEDNIYGVEVIADLNGGAITDGDISGIFINVDQESGHTIGQSAYGFRCTMDLDGTVSGGSSYLLNLYGYSGVDFGIYQGSTEPNVLKGKLAVGNDISPEAYIQAKQTSINTTESVIGIESYLTKTAGATNSSDDVIGIKGTTTFSQAAGLIGDLSSYESTVTQSNGTCSNIAGADIVVNQTAGVVSSNAYGARIAVDLDGTITGTSYTIFLEDSANTDYGIYQNGSNDNYFGGLLETNADRIRIRTTNTPASASATGTAGDICWDASYIYVCTATNTWKRVAIATW